MGASALYFIRRPHVMEMNNLWRPLIGAILAIGIALGSWTMKAVANMPKEYTTKQELRELRKENREDHKDILKQIERLLDKV